MNPFTITVKPGTPHRLLTAGKYCDRDIVVTAEGSGGGDGGELDALLDGSLENLNSKATKLLAYACYQRTALKTVNLPEATDFERYAFYGCSNLATFYAPNVTKLGASAFYNCSKLSEIKLSLTSSVPSSGFYKCTSLTKADLGEATAIDSSGFAYCTALETVILRKTDAVVTLNSAGFSNANFDGFVYVPAALVDSYKAASNWTVHASRIRAIEDYPDICGT